MDEIMFCMDDSLLSATDDCYKGSWSGLDAVKAGGVGNVIGLISDVLNCNG
jgi:hypothetical protein